jgi:hypothetical protein
MSMSNAVLWLIMEPLSCGKSLDEALIVAEIVEKSAHVYCINSINRESFHLATNDIKLLRYFYVEHFVRGKEAMNK